MTRAGTGDTRTVPVYDRWGVKVFEGDCLDVLRGMDACSIHSIVTDPPSGTRFMNRAWDSDMGGRHSWVAWLTERMAEAYRVLKPGGHALVWAMPRTSHWTAWALEDAGFEVRDCIVHLFGCLTDDVEILTESGWRRGIDVPEGDRIAQWDATNSEISLAEVQRTYRAPWRGNLVKFANSDTDQALTPNHRVWHRGVLWKRWSDYRVREASEVSRRSPCRLPLAGLHDGPGIGGTDYAALLGWVWTEGGFDRSGTGVRIYQSTTNQAKVDEIASLMDRVGPHKRYDQARSHTRRNGERYEYTAVTWFFTRELAERVRADLPGKHPRYDLMWRMTLAEKQAFIDSALKGDGSRGSGGSWTFYQDGAEDREWFATLLALVGWRGHLSARKPPRSGGSVSVSQRPDTTISTAKLRNGHEWYEGDVWCVQVPTGAFVARRHGKVFITGNSGFPKSLDVSQAIDKAVGAEREIVGTKTAGASSLQRVSRVEQGYRNSLTSCTPDSIPVTAAATDAAQQWSGWHTALKPAAEHWWLIRKPLSGTVAATVLEHGTGALNIGACRVAANGRPLREVAPLRPDVEYRGSALEGRVDGSLASSRAAGTTDQGRWPSNVVLTHSPLLDPVSGEVIGDACADGCQPGCAVLELDRQSGTTSVTGRRSARSKAATVEGTTWGTDNHESREYPGDSGGASRFFPQFRWEAKAPTAERPRVNGTAHPTVKPRALIQWLVRLVTPPGGTVLDCFAGTGTTGQAARAEGFPAILIESDPASIPLIKARLDALPKTEATAEPAAPDDDPVDLFGLIDGDVA